MSYDMLSIQLFDNWTLINPFWVASADLSHNVAGLRRLSELEPPPGAVTLKTTAPKKRLDFRPTKKYSTYVTLHRDPFQSKPRAQSSPTLYCDGPPEEEYLSIPKTRDLLLFARDHLPMTRVGISVLMEENYEEIATALHEIAGFAELNLKYAARLSASQATESFLERQQQVLTSMIEHIENFCAAFSTIPVFIKLTREIPWLPVACRETEQLVHSLSKVRANRQIGIIIANTRRQRVPNDLISNANQRRDVDELRDGILAGEHLYIETYNLIRNMALNYQRLASVDVPIIATGGITTLSSFIEILRAGAKAAQIYTGLHAYGIDYFSSLCDDLAKLVNDATFTSFQQLLAAVQREPNPRVRDLAWHIPMRDRKRIRQLLEENEDYSIRLISDDLRRRLQRTTYTHPTDQAGLTTAATFGLPELSKVVTDATPQLIRATIRSSGSNFDANILFRFMGTKNSDLAVEEFDRVTDLLDYIAAGEPWELGVLTEPYLTELQSLENQTYQPVLLGQLLETEYVLGGFADPERATDIYTFGGPESKFVLKKLLEEDFPEVPITPVKTDAVLLWLHSGRKWLTLLVRDPLFTGYRMLSSKMKLEPFKRVGVPVYLLASRDYCARNSAEDLKALYAAVFEAQNTLISRSDDGEVDNLIREEAWKIWRRYFSIPED